MSKPKPRKQGPRPNFGDQPAPELRSPEGIVADLHALLAAQDFDSIDDARAYLNSLLAQTGGRVPRTTAARSPLQQAQELMYEAWENPTRRERLAAARRALEICADCADAYTLLASETARTPSEAIDLFAKGVAAAERVLGERAFREDVGHFWGVFETRPYMRARYGLAEALWRAGRRDEALAHARDLIRLDPGDHMGLRFDLIGWLLETRCDDEARALAERYSDDATAQLQYARALIAFRLEGDAAAAKRELAEAIRRNPFVTAYLLGRKSVPRQLPEGWSPGGESEAQLCAAKLLEAWYTTPGALAWLGDNRLTRNG